MRRTWLSGRANVEKRYLLHVAGHNLGLIMRLLTGHGTPREAAAALHAAIAIVLLIDDMLTTRRHRGRGRRSSPPSLGWALVGLVTPFWPDEAGGRVEARLPDVSEAGVPMMNALPDSPQLEPAAPLNMVKIAFVTTRFSTGGAQLMAVRIAREMANRGHAVQLWSLYRAGDLDNGGLPTAVMLDRPVKTPLDLFRLLVMIVRFTRNVSGWRPDVVVAFQPLANIVGATVGAVYGVQTRAVVLANPPESQRGVTAWLERRLGASSLYTASIAVSASVRSAFANFPEAYRRKFVVIHNGVDKATFCGDRKTARRRLGLPENGFFFGAVARLSAQKGLDLLVDLLAAVTDAALVLAGDGEEREALCRQAEKLGVADRLHLLGYIAPSRVGEVYKALDVVTISSHYEGFCLTLVEAMQNRRPIIASDLTALREVAGEPPGAVLLPRDDPEAWQRQLLEFKDTPCIAEDLVERAERRARDFSIATMVDEYERVLLRTSTGSEPQGCPEQG